MIRPLRKDAAAAMRFLARDLVDPCAGDGTSARKYDNRPGTYDRLCIERIGPHRYSLAHYYSQNGDTIADPDIELTLAGGKWYPVAIQQPIGGYTVAVRCDDDGRPTHAHVREYNGIREVCQIMLRNCIDQQGLADQQRAWLRGAREVAHASG